MLATIGYEKSSPHDFLETLIEAEIDILVDVRDRAQSRRPGFSKTALASSVEGAGLEYIHLRALGDPKPGRDAARAGELDKFRAIFSEVLSGEAAQEAVAQVKDLLQSKRVCLMCYERDHKCCHRTMVSDEIEKSLDIKVRHLGVRNSSEINAARRRVLHSDQGVAS